MKRLWKKNIDGVKPYIPGKPIQEVKRDLGIENVIKLASNENPLSPSPRVIDAINKAAKEVNRYPEGSCFYLRKALAEKLDVEKENLVFGNGSDEIIVLALRAFIEPGDEVLISDPTFAVYGIASQVEGAAVKYVPMKDMTYDVDSMISAISGKTKIIFIANPDNPTGCYMTDSELKKLIDAVDETMIVVIDEAYYEFARGDDYPETVGLIDRSDKNILVTRTFSKVYGLAGLRIGYGIARKDIAGAIDKVREPFNVNSIAQEAALAAVGDTEYVEKVVALVETEKKRYYSFLNEINIDFKPSRTNFILISTGRDSRKVADYLLSNGVIVREMSSWRLKGYIRVNIGLPGENDRFFEVFRKAVENIPGE